MSWFPTSPSFPKPQQQGQGSFYCLRQQTLQGADAVAIAKGGGRLEWLAVCHFLLRHLFQCLQSNNGDNLIPPLLGRKYQSLSLPPHAAWDVCSLLFVLWQVSLETDGAGEKRKPTDPPHECLAQIRALLDDIITTTELASLVEAPLCIFRQRMSCFKVRETVTMIRPTERSAEMKTFRGSVSWGPRVQAKRCQGHIGAKCPYGQRSSLQCIGA